MEQTIMINISISDLRSFFREEVEGVIKEQLEPLKRRYEEKYLTVKEVATALGVTTRTVHNRVDSGSLTAYGKGKNMRFKESEITQYLEGRQ